MALLLHLSDPHFGTERPEVVAALLDLSVRLQPQVVVLSGDITQRARRSQFASARAFWQALTAQHRLVLPGNHDLPLFNLWARLRAPYAAYQAALGPVEAPMIDTPAYRVIGVNTTRAGRHQDGEVSPAQIDAVSQRLRAARPGQLRVVVTHQPMAVITPQDRRHLLHGHAQAAAAWRDAGVDLLLGGHIHLPYVVPLPADSLGVTARPAWVVQAGTAVSSRVRGGLPNSVHLIDWRGPGSDGGCWWAQYDYRQGPRCFVQVGPAMKLTVDTA